MTKTEYDILTYIQARGSCAWIDVLNHVRSNCDVDFQTIDATLNRCLLSHKWIKTTSVAKPPLCTIRLTPSGLIVLDIAKHEAAEQAEKHAQERTAESKRLIERTEDRADEERRYRTQNKITIVMTLVPLLVGLLTEHFFGIITVISKLFH